MTAEVAPVQLGPQERALLTGDLSKLNEQQRSALYEAVCRSIGLNPLTRPLEYLTLNGRMVLYARKDCTDQLRAMHGISIACSKPEVINDILYVTAHATTPNGRTDEDMGAVPVAGLRGEALANANMKCVTKAKRRATLSICGLGLLDDTEVDSIPGAVRVQPAAPRQLAPASPEPEAPTEKMAGPNMRAELRRLADQVLALSPGQVYQLPERMTHAEAIAHKAALVEILADLDPFSEPAPAPVVAPSPAPVAAR